MKNYLVFSSSKETLNYFFENIIDNIADYETIYYEQENTIDEVLQEINMVSLFSCQKIIVKYTNLEFEKDEEKKLMEFLEKSKTDNYLILVINKEADKRKKIVKYFISKNAYLKENEIDLERFVKEYLQKENKKMTEISYFLKLVGDNLNNIKNELDKLILTGMEIIDKELIDKVVYIDIEDNIFAFTDALIRKDKARSIYLYKQLKKLGYDEVALIAVVASQIKNLYSVKRLYNQGNSYEQISTYLEFNNHYRAKAIHRNSFNYTEDDLILYLKKLAEIDYRIKSGQGEKSTLFELFLINKDINE